MSHHADITFNGGDDVLAPFTLTVSGEVADVTGCVVSAEVWWRGKARIALTEGSGMALIFFVPDADQPHGYIRLIEEQTLLVPRGRIAFVRYIVVNSDGITMSTEPQYLNRML